MADYDSGYTGPQIDAGIGLAGTALQPADRFGGWAQYQDSVYTDVARETVNLEVRTPYTVDGLLPASNTDHLDTLPQSCCGTNWAKSSSPVKSSVLFEY